MCGGILRLLEAALQAAAQDELADRAFTGVLLDDQSRLERLAKVLESADWDGAIAALDEEGAWKRPAGSTAAGAPTRPPAPPPNCVTAPKSRPNNCAKDWLLCTAAEFAADRRRAAPLVEALVQTVQLFADAYFQAKLAEKVLDYADYEHLTLDLLQTQDGARTPLCKTVSRQYAAVLVDEYQDTNALQDAIYFSLAAPDASNLFFVGDIKQSIYRFRQADPSVFAAKQAAWRPYPDPQQIPFKEPATISLGRQFSKRAGCDRGHQRYF